MTKEELVSRMYFLQSRMGNVAYDLDAFGGSEESSKHAAELAEASEMVGQWADALLKEAKNEVE